MRIDVVPLAVDCIRLKREDAHLLLGRLDTYGIVRRIETALDGQAGRHGRRSDQTQDDRVATSGEPRPFCVMKENS